MLQLDAIIGRGGFGTVYRGTLRSDDGLTRRVAVKVLSDELSDDAEAVSRLRDEARLLALLDHPALVPVFALQPVDDRWAVVMGLVEGADVRQLMKRLGSLPGRAVCELGVEAAEVLSSIWERTHPESGDELRVVHRDIKPQNLMVDRAGRLRLLDLGVASARFEAREAQTRGGVAGTLAYMSPQRWARQDDGHKGDIYALAATMLHAATGELPPEAGTEPEEHAARMDAALDGLGPDAAPMVAALRAGLSWSDLDRPDGHGFAERLREAHGDCAGPGLRQLGATVVLDVIEAMESRVRGPTTSLSGSSWDLLPSSGTETDPLETGWIFTQDPEPDSGPEPASKKGVAWLYGAAGLAALAGVAGLLLPQLMGPSGPPLRFAVPPVNPPEIMAEALAPLTDHLESELDRPVELVVADSYGHTKVLHEQGGSELTLLTPLLYVQLLAEGELEPLAMTDPVVMSGHEGVLLVARDILDLDGLRGQVICFTDPNSTSGFLLPRRYLRENGLEPARDYEARLSGGHAQVVQDLAAGRCKAAGTYMNAFADAAQHDETNGAQVFARTGLAAHNTVSCGIDTDCTGFAEALLSFSPGEAGSDAFRINGFVEHDPEVYADLVDAWAAENAE